MTITMDSGDSVVVSQCLKTEYTYDQGRIVQIRIWREGEEAYNMRLPEQDHVAKIRHELMAGSPEEKTGLGY